MEYVIKILDILAWPATVMILLWMGRKPIQKLIPFIENAFKYSLLTTIVNGYIMIRYDLTVKECIQNKNEMVNISNINMSIDPVFIRVLTSFRMYDTLLI